MFGWGRRQVERYNSLNPLCAIVYHELQNLPNSIPLFSLPSEQMFEDKLFRSGLDGYYAASREERDKIGVEKAMQNSLSRIADSLSKTAAQSGREAGDGAGMAMYYIRHIVFGIAPGLSSKGPHGAHTLALRMIATLANLYADKTPNTFLHGVYTCCAVFVLRCHERYKLSTSEVPELSQFHLRYAHPD